MVQRARQFVGGACLLVTAVLCGTLQPSPAAAQVYGTLQAVAGPAVPPLTTVAVQAMEYDSVNTAIVDAIRRALVARGIRIDPNATMVLSFDTEWSAATADASGAGGVDDTEVGAPGVDQDLFPGSDIGTLYGEDEMPSSPLMTFPLGRAGTDGGQRYSLTFFLGLSGASPVWQGGVRAKLPEQDPVPVAKVMIAPLVRAIGKTVAPTRVVLQQ